MNQAEDSRFVSRLTRKTLALVLAGGKGSRLRHLTDWRAKPAVPFGGKFRIIDFPLSNCINSGIRQISVLTQYKAHSLILHIQKGWNFLRGEFGEFVELLPAQQRLQEHWYAGTADAVYQNMDIFRGHDPEYILILAGDHIYKMDYGMMVAYHASQQADLTVACLEVPLEMAKSFGVMRVDEENRILSFIEKPEEPEPTPHNPEQALASMGIYIFSARFLYEQLLQDAENANSSRDFGRDVIPSIIGNPTYKAIAYPFRDKNTGQKAYWRDVGTVDAFWAANMDLVSVSPELNIYDREWPIWTYQEQLPPAKFVFNETTRRGMAVDSMVSGGCVISGSKIMNSLLFSNVKTHSYAQLEEAILLPNVDVGEGCQIRRAVIDKGCQIPAGMNIGVDAEQDLENGFHISPHGIVVVTPDMLGQRVHHAG